MILNILLKTVKVKENVIIIPEGAIWTASGIIIIINKAIRTHTNQFTNNRDKKLSIAFFLTLSLYILFVFFCSKTFKVKGNFLVERGNLNS